MKTQKASELLKDRTIIGVDNDCVNTLVLWLDNGARVTIAAETYFSGNGTVIPSIEVTKDN